MSNEFNHADALEYAAAFNRIVNKSLDSEFHIERWHSQFGEHGSITNTPTSTQLAALRGIESAGVFLDGDPAKFKRIVSDRPVVLDQS